PYGRNVRLQAAWTADDERFFDAAPSGAMTAAPNGAATVTSGLLARGISVDQLPAVIERQRDYFLHAGEAGNASILAYLGTLPGRFPRAKLATLDTVVPPAEPTSIEGSINVGMRRTSSRFTDDLPFWVSIRKSTDALSFDRYFDFMNWLFCDDPKTDPLITP